MPRVLAVTLFALAALGLSLSGCVWGFESYDDGYWDGTDTGGWWDYNDDHSNWWSPSRPPSTDDDHDSYDPWDGGQDTWQPPNDDPFDDDGGGSNVPLSTGASTS